MIPKYQTVWGKMPLVLNTEGQQQWIESHEVDGGTLPEVTISAPKPLTEFQHKDKANGIKLGRITSDSDQSYRNWQANIHYGNKAAKKIGKWGASLAMGLAGTFTSFTPAGIYADVAMGLGALPNNIDNLKNAATNKQYTKAATIGSLMFLDMQPFLKERFPIKKINEYTQIPKTVKVQNLEKEPYTNAQNKIISAWRDAAAVGNRRKAKRALLKWWRLKSPNDKAISIYPSNPTVTYYHSTNSETPIKVFDLSKSGKNWEQSNRFGKPAIFFEANYVANKGQWGKKSSKYFINTENLHSDLDLSKSSYRHSVPSSATTLSESPNHVTTGLADPYNTPRILPVKEPSKVFHEMVVFDPKLIKSADPFTYDNAGKLIDITERFNFNNPNVMYGLTTLLGINAVNKMFNKDTNKKPGLN